MRLDSLLDTAPGLVAMYNYESEKYEYFSNNVKNILGYDQEKYISKGIDCILATCHPSFAKIFSNYIRPTIEKDFVKYGAKGDITKMRFSCDYWLKLGNGQYKWFNNQMAVLKTNKAGLPQLGIIFLVDIDGYKKDTAIRYSISCLDDTSKLYSTIHKASYNIGMAQENAAAFTDREIEVVKLLAGGLTSGEIASRLHISPHTVNNHRKNMLEKIRAKNTAELLKMAMEIGIV